MSTQAKNRHAALLNALGDEEALPGSRASGKQKGNPDASVPALGTAGELLREELQAERERADTLQQEVEVLRNAPAERKIDAKLIRHGRFRDRHELGFKDAAFEELRSSIQAEGGNKVAILVRPLSKPDAEGRAFEVVWGHRRHQACLDLGLEVNANVRELSDRDAVILMTLENKLREGLSQFELARTYKGWLDAKLFPNQQAIADRERLNQATISRIMMINELPAEVVELVEDPRKITGLWASKVLPRLAEDATGVRKRLEAVKGKLTPKALMNVIAPPAPLEPREVKVGDTPIFQAMPTRNSKGQVTWNTLKLCVKLDEAQLEKLAAFVAKL